MSTPRTALKGTSLLVDAVLTQTGYAGQTVTLDVEDGGRIVGSQPVRLPADGDPVSVRVRFTATEAGPRVFRLKVSPQPGEVVTQNNQRDVQIDIRDRTRAHPLLRRGAALRDEVRAAGDQGRSEPRSSSRCSARPRTSISVSTSSEPATSSSPASRRRARSCSRYRGLVLGSVEASAFTADQLRMISEFVDVRGGGLLLLGGRARSPKAAMPARRSPKSMPVVHRTRAAAARSRT